MKRITHYCIVFCILCIRAQAEDSAVSAISGTSQLPPAAPEVHQQKSLRFTFLTATYLGVEATGKGQGEATAFNQIRADYKLSDRSGVRINQLFSNGFGVKNDGKSEFLIGDIYAQYSRQKLVALPLGVTVNGYARVYLPVSELSQSKGQIASTQFAAILEKEFSDSTSLSLNLIPNLSLQRKDSYEITDSKGSISRKANSNSSFWYYLSGSTKVTKSLSFAQDLGLMRYWFKSDPSNNVSGSLKEYLYADTSLTMAVTETLEIGLGLSSYLARDLLAQQNPFSVYRPDETDYYLAGTVHF